MALSDGDRVAIADIGWHWDAAYLIDHDGEVYSATRLGAPHCVVTADTTAELRQAIRRDYFNWTASLRGERMST